MSWVPGKFGNAVQLSGNGQYVVLPTGIVNGLTDFTVACWVNPAAITTWSRFFDFGTGTTAYMFLTVDAGSGPRFAITTSGFRNAVGSISAQWVSAGLLTSAERAKIVAAAGAANLTGPR